MEKTEYKNLSEKELQAVIELAEKALKDKQASKRKQVMNQINELAASIGVIVEVVEKDRKSSRKSTKVAAKYRHPNDPEITWTGRGVTPKWLKALLDAGHDRSEFQI